MAREKLKTYSLWLGPTLTWIAGFIDAVGYLMLRHIYTANMSGNSIAFSMYAARNFWIRGLLRGFPVLMFFAGLMLGGIVLEWRKRNLPGHLFSTAMLLEFCFLLAYPLAGFHSDFTNSGAALGLGKFLVLVAALSIAMGVQNTTLRMTGVLTIYTTHVTGAITQLSEDAVSYLFWAGEKMREGLRGMALLRASWRQGSFRGLLLNIALWVGYIAGAGAGAIGVDRMGVICVLVPMALVLALTLFDHLGALGQYK
ncbi:MAG TPA: YoaK family protein [Candidatus Acidoferrales bacterium]|nr:YoaK family protein [Candidatus Acidoferrales bacterium]